MNYQQQQQQNEINRLRMEMDILQNEVRKKDYRISELERQVANVEQEQYNQAGVQFQIRSSYDDMVNYVNQLRDIEAESYKEYVDALLNKRLP